MLQNTLYKVYAAIVAHRVLPWAVEKGIMSPSQKGFLPMEGCLEHNHLMSSVLQDSRRRKRPVYLTWLDLKDAYGSVPHEILSHFMELTGLERRTVEVVKDLYHQTTTFVRTKRNSTAPFRSKEESSRAAHSAQFSLNSSWRSSSEWQKEWRELDTRWPTLSLNPWHLQMTSVYLPLLLLRCRKCSINSSGLARGRIYRSRQESVRPYLLSGLTGPDKEWPPRHSNEGRPYYLRWPGMIGINT